MTLRSNRATWATTAGLVAVLGVVASCGGKVVGTGPDSGGATPTVDGGGSSDAAGGEDTPSSDGGPPSDGTLPDVAADVGMSFDATPDSDAAPAPDGGPVIIASLMQVTALAADDDFVYWVDALEATVSDCPATGCPGNVSTLLAKNGYGYGSESLEVAASTAYYVDAMSLSIDDCGAKGCGLSPPAFTTSAPGIGSVRALQVDSSNVYFSDYASVYQCPLGSTCTSPVALTTLAPSLDGGTGGDGGEAVYINRLAVSPTEVFYTLYGGDYGIHAVPIGGGPSRLVCAGAYAGDYLVYAGGYVYFTLAPYSGYSAVLQQCPAAGGAVATYVSDINPRALAADGTNLYWANYAGTGTVVACALGATCSSPRVLASGQSFPDTIAVNSTHVFWTTASVDIRSALK